ncbi:MAG: MotA/TolQ/ExbB proton channel family protein [Thermoguttaceae bacterium]
MTTVLNYLGIFIYVLLGVVAFWGAYSVIILWRRISQLSFKNEAEQVEFLEAVQQYVTSDRTDELEKLCEYDPRAVAQMVVVAIRYKNTHKEKIQAEKLRDLFVERFQRDVSAELDYRGSWVQTIIKAAPMLGLYGTVVGMMGAFGKLSAVSQVSPDKLASDISVALITTACGLTIAIPLILATASTNNRISKLEDLTSSGINRLIEIFCSK